MERTEARRLLEGLLRRLKYQVSAKRKVELFLGMYEEQIGEEHMKEWTQESAGPFMRLYEEALEEAVKALGETELTEKPKASW